MLVVCGPIRHMIRDVAQRHSSVMRKASGGPAVFQADERKQGIVSVEARNITNSKENAFSTRLLRLLRAHEATPLHAFPILRPISCTSAFEAMARA